MQLEDALTLTSGIQGRIRLNVDAAPLNLCWVSLRAEATLRSNSLLTFLPSHHF